MAQETRQRIVDAALALHAERGVLGTKPAQIAARAEVALTTFYNHFPALGSLVRACTARGRELIPAPDSAIVSALPPVPAVRIERMTRTLFEYYEAREPWLYVGRTEERLVPELQPLLEAQRAVRDAFVRAALEGMRASPEEVAVAIALVDFWAWRTLRRDVGLSQEEAVRAVSATIQRAVHQKQKGKRGKR
jgi:AcrR family transcriptional regulator